MPAMQAKQSQITEDNLKKYYNQPNNQNMYTLDITRPTLYNNDDVNQINHNDNPGDS